MIFARAPGVIRKPFGLLPSGDPSQLFTLASSSGVLVKITDYGGIIVSILAPDREGYFSDIVLGHDALEDYLDNKAYFGALNGRVANRIAGAQFDLDGVTHHITPNEGRHALHGGPRGFDQALWKAESFERDHERGVKLTHVSPDGDQGFPGELRAEVTYTLSDLDELAIDYAAETQRATLVNMTQHSYFNLSGRQDRDILDHVASIAADRYLPLDSELIPTGALTAVAGSAFDFRSARRLGEFIRAADPQISLVKGYDHNFVLNKADSEFALAARIVDKDSGRLLEVHTSEPGLQLYTGNQLDGSIVGKAQLHYEQYGGFTLVTQHFPDSAHQPEFPSVVLRPGQTLRSRTVYRFATTGVGGSAA
jgi:aldose 1-epimerase